MAGLFAHWQDILFALIALGLILWIAWDALYFRFATYARTSDYWEHAAALRALLENPWHPANPQIVSSASSPRFVPHFVAIALLGRGLSLDALQAMGISAISNVMLFVIGIRVFFHSYFQDAHAPLLGLIVLLAGWGDAFDYSNVYQLKTLFYVASYPSTAALGLSFLAFGVATLELRASKSSTARLALLGLLCADVLITHQLTATLTISGLVLLIATESRLPLRRRLWVAAALSLGCLLALAWPYFSFGQVLIGGQDRQQGWAEKAVAKALTRQFTLNRTYFYDPQVLLRLLGPCLGALPVLAYFLVFRRHLFVALGAMAMAIPFVVSRFIPIPLGFRFILLVIPYLHMALVWLLIELNRGTLERWPWLRARSWRYVARALVGLVLCILSLHHIGAAHSRFAQLKQSQPEVPSQYVRNAMRLVELGGPRAVVLAALDTSWSIPAFGPRIVALLHDNPLVPDQYQRQVLVKNFLLNRTDEAGRIAILQRYRVTHVILRADAPSTVQRFMSLFSEKSFPFYDSMLYQVDMKKIQGRAASSAE